MEKKVPIQNQVNELADEILQDDSARKEVLTRARGHIKLLVDPKLYAEGAVECITRQLETVRSPKRRAKLESKLKVWTETLRVLNEDL